MFVGERMMTHILSQPEMPRRRWKSGSGGTLSSGARERLDPSSPASARSRGSGGSTCPLTPWREVRGELGEGCRVRLFARSTKRKLARCSTSPRPVPKPGR